MSASSSSSSTMMDVDLTGAGSGSDTAEVDITMQRVSGAVHGADAISPESVAARNHFSAMRERHQQEPIQLAALLYTDPQSGRTPSPPSAASSSSSPSSSSSSSSTPSPDSPPVLVSSPFGSSFGSGGGNVILSPGTKRHITTVLNPHVLNQNFRVHSPSPPKSPVRGGDVGVTSAHSPMRRHTTPTEGSSTGPSPLASPVRGRHFSAAGAHSPTRLGGGHGLPASPRTPPRRRASTSTSASPLRSSRSTPPPPPRSPVGAFYFPAGVPASPASRLQHQSSVLQVALHHPHGFDEAALTDLVSSVIKLPVFVTPYVFAQCRAVQQGKRELRLAAEEQLAERARRARSQRPSAQRQPPTSRAVHDTSASDMSIDGNDPRTVASPTAGPVGNHDAAHAMHTPTSAGHTAHSSPASSPADVADFLTPPSISRIRSASGTGCSDLLHVSPLNGSTAPDVGDDAASLDDSDEFDLILPQTFLFYFSHLEKFRDPATRLFKIMQGDIAALLDKEEEEEVNASQVQTDDGPMQVVLEPMSTAGASLQPSSRSPLHLPSPRDAIGTGSSVALQSPTSPQSTPSPITAALTPSHFEALLDCILATHPGLQFLQATPEFQVKYSQTCIVRIFYALSPRGGDRLTLTDLRRSCFLEELRKLESEEDINLSVKFFSYQHFYVLYCKFWELDSPDHDGFLTLANLCEYEQGSLSTRMCERIIATCPKPVDEGESGTAAGSEDATSDANIADDLGLGSPHYSSDLAPPPLHEPRMSYAQFVPFFLSECDKTTPQSLRYWFRLLDIDHDHVLSLFELDWWFSDQIDKIQNLSSDTIRWNDIVCQVLDMVKTGRHDHAHAEPSANKTRAETSDRHHLPGGSMTQQAPLLSSASSFVRTASDPILPSAAPSVPLLSASSLAFEFSSCHITLKDLSRSKQGAYFFNLLFNLPRFLLQESRDPNKSRIAHENEERGITEWESYAATQYQALVANEELQSRASEQQQQHEVQMDDPDSFEAHDDHSHMEEHDGQQSSRHHLHQHDRALRCEEEDLMEEEEEEEPEEETDPAACSRHQNRTCVHSAESTLDADMSDCSAAHAQHAQQQQQPCFHARSDNAALVARRAAGLHQQHASSGGPAAAALDFDSREFLHHRFQVVTGDAAPTQRDAEYASVPASAFTEDDSRQARARAEEERAYLAMQRKIHSSSGDDEDESEEHDATEEDAIAAPPARTALPLHRLHLVDDMCKENSFPSSPPSTAAAAPSTAPNAHFKRQLQFAEPVKTTSTSAGLTQMTAAQH